MGKTRKKKARDPSFLPFYFSVCAFSIQRTQLSRSLEQAINVTNTKQSAQVIKLTNTKQSAQAINVTNTKKNAQVTNVTNTQKSAQVINVTNKKERISYQSNKHET